ncbi:MAG: hypothetical protein NTX03_05790, partial [Bacteroidetes bacterium]|nr:hypothetical protein [Bacteroidota bacterium]
TYRQYAIEPFAMGEILPLAFGEFYRKMNHPFYCIIGNYVAFANTPSSLKNAIDAYLDNQTISQASSAKAFMKNLSTDCNFLLYINPSRAADLGKKYIRENIASAYETNLPLLKGLEGFGFQVSAAGEHLYNTIILTKPSASDETVEVGWSTHLEAEMIGKPSIISNSDTKAKEVFVQDEKFTLYLLNADGVIIWKKKLDAQISGGVEPISLYGDGNTQYIFATKNSLYMLKHNGENAGNYPLHLGSRATSPLAVFNFNGTQNFNYFIGTQNNRIYGYHANGKPLSGWNPQMLDAPLVQPLKTAFIDGENYLFGVSNRGTFYLWNTAGDKLIKPREFHRKPTSPAYLKAAEKLEKSAFYFADTAATVTEIYPKGNATRFYTDGSGMPACFNCIMPTQNQKPLFSISSKKHIYTYEKGGKGFWKINAETLVDLPFVNCQINGKNYIAYGSSLTNQIYLSTLDGKKFKGFPVNGNTEFIIDDINQDGTPDLICGGQGRMVYLYLVK